MGVQNCHFTSTQTQIYTHRFPVCTPSVASRGPCHLLRVFEAAVWCERRDGFVLLFFHLKEWIVPCKPLKWRASTSIFPKGWINLFQFGLRSLLVQISTAWPFFSSITYCHTDFLQLWQVLSKFSLILLFWFLLIIQHWIIVQPVDSRLAGGFWEIALYLYLIVLWKVKCNVICRALCHVPCIAYGSLWSIITLNIRETENPSTFSCTLLQRSEYGWGFWGRGQKRNKIFRDKKKWERLLFFYSPSWFFRVLSASSLRTQEALLISILQVPKCLS